MSRLMGKTKIFGIASAKSKIQDKVLQKTIIKMKSLQIVLKP